MSRLAIVMFAIVSLTAFAAVPNAALAGKGDNFSGSVGGSNFSGKASGSGR